LKNRDIFGKLIMLNLLRKRRIMERAGSEGLYDGQLPVLECLITLPGITQQELSNRLLVRPASIAQSTKRLQAAGLIEKRADESNLRINRLYATENGVAIAKKHRQCLNEVDTMTVEGLTDAEKEILLSLLTRMIENVNVEKLPFRPPWKEDAHV